MLSPQNYRLVKKDGQLKQKTPIKELDQTMSLLTILTRITLNLQERFHLLDHLITSTTVVVGADTVDQVVLQEVIRTVVTL